MELFTQCEGVVIVSRGGVDYQRNLFRRGNALYVQQGSGFVRLRSNGETSVPRLRWITLQTPKLVAIAEFGYLMLCDDKNTKQKHETENVFVVPAA